MQKTKTLSNGKEIPVLGFGTWGLDEGKEQQSIEHALSIGFRHIDTADIYHTHKFVAEAINSSGVQREDIFLTTKLWKDTMTPVGVAEAVKRFLEELDVDYIDLLLIHRRNFDVELEETLKAMQNQVTAGLVKSIGVSNFREDDIKEALETDVEIVMNQIEQHPSLNEEDLRAFCESNNIAITAYAPFARGYDFQLAIIQELAEKYDKPAPQVVLNWILQKGMIAVPKSSNKDHIKSNFEALSWELSNEDIERIDEIDEHYRVEEMR